MTETTTAPTAPAAPALDPTNLAAPPEPTQRGGQPRRGSGEYGKKDPNRPNKTNLSAVARNVVRSVAGEARKSLGKETDAKALEEVRPKGEGAKQTKDPAPQSAKATDAKSPEESSPAATLAATHMADARKALALDGYSDDDLAKFSPERILALGKKAKERQAEVGRKLEEAAKTKAATPSDASKSDPASQKAATTDKPQTKTDEPDPFDALYKKHFAGFEDNADFAKSLGGFSKEFATQLQSEIATGIKGLAEQFTAMRADMVREIREEAARETEFERAVDALKDDFPESSSVDGRSALRDLFVTLAKEGKVKDIKQGVLQSADALWAQQRREREAAAAKSKASSDARKNGQPFTGSSKPAPENKPRPITSIALQEVRRARDSQ